MKSEVKDGVTVVRLEDWRQFVNEIAGSGRHAGWAFRGQADATWPVYSSLSRYLKSHGVRQDLWPFQEARIIRIFKRKAHLFLDQVPPDDDDFRWIASMQHHGAPTRLLDFTWSPYVAAFFALERATEDPAVWAVHPGVVWQNRKLLPPHFQDLRHPGTFARVFLKNDHTFIWQGEPMVMNQRLNVQAGTFIVPSRLDVPLEQLVAYYPKSENYVFKFVFNQAAVRGEAMRSLYDMNINYASLFPDLDGLARSLGYELETHWAYDPLSGKVRDGFSDDQFHKTLDLGTTDYEDEVKPTKPGHRRRNRS